MKQNSLIIKSLPTGLTGSLLFENENPFTLELGSGMGEFLVAMAEKNLGENFLGIDFNGSRIKKSARLAMQHSLNNIRFHRNKIDVSFLTEFQLGSVDRIIINFPDPWPKERHFKQRLIQMPLVTALAKIIKPGGVLSFGTDCRRYAKESFALFLSSGHFINTLSPAWRTESIKEYTETYFQNEKCDEDTPPNFLLFRRCTKR
jgi:tRNA (guanine-N7-)-methyltransferase